MTNIEIEIKKQRKLITQLLVEEELRKGYDQSPIKHYYDGKINAFNFCLKLFEDEK